MITISLIKQYDKVAEDYFRLKTQFFKEKEDRATKYLFKALPNLENKVVLDFGCGFGYTIKKLERRKAKKIYGIDTSKVMLNKAKDVLKNSNNLFLENIEKTHFKDNTFEIIYSRFSLHYLKSFTKAYNEIHRILKKKGVLVLVVSHPIMNLLNKKELNYFDQEIFDTKVYHNKMTVKFPSHTFKDYFSKTFFKNFRLIDLMESTLTSIGSKSNLPGVLVIKAKMM